LIEERNESLSFRASPASIQGTVGHTLLCPHRPLNPGQVIAATRFGSQPNNTDTKGAKTDYTYDPINRGVIFSSCPHGHSVNSVVISGIPCPKLTGSLCPETIGIYANR